MTRKSRFMWLLAIVPSVLFASGYQIGKKLAFRDSAMATTAR